MECEPKDTKDPCTYRFVVFVFFVVKYSDYFKDGFPTITLKAHHSGYHFLRAATRRRRAFSLMKPSASFWL